MLRIEKHRDESVTGLRLSGRLESDLIASIRSAMSNSGACKVLDLSEVTLVDVAVVRFLITCEDEGIELVECPPYVREWILRERAQKNISYRSRTIGSRAYSERHTVRG